MDIVCDAIQQGASAAPDVTTAAEPAAVSLIAWVGGRNKALGLPDLTGQYAESVKKVVLQNISAIADGAWRNNRGRDQARRQKAAADLRGRLSWKKFEELQQWAHAR